MSLLGAALLAILVVWAIRRLRRDLDSGMRLIFALLVFLPTSLRIELPGALPQLTIQRILILIAFVFLLRNAPSVPRKWPIPNLTLITLFGITQGVSLVFGAQFIPGLKGFSSYILEVALFYVLMNLYIMTEPNLLRLVCSICYGLAAVAVLATIEKFSGTNLSELIAPSGGLAEIKQEITSTYPHRIALGYAMAMGVPLALAASTQFRSARTRRLLYGIALLSIGAAYFSMSRGPWLGMGLGLIGIGILGGTLLRKRLLQIALLSAAVLVLRPGVLETITNLYTASFDENAQKHGSLATRWQLWTVAWTEIQVSPERFLFGFGPVSTESMDLSQYWYGTEGWSASVSKIGYTSWDNNYACDLIELGVVGLALEVTLLLAIVGTVLREWRASDAEGRILLSGIGLACAVFMFAMTNVYIFAPQLKYLFWALVAIGSNFHRAGSTEETTQTWNAMEAELEPHASDAVLGT